MDFLVLKNSVYSSPAFVLDEIEVIKALEMLAELRTQCGCKVLYSIKSLPFSAVMDRAKSFVDGFSVSSLFEARLADEMIRQDSPQVLAGQGSIHLTTPGIRHDELDELSMLCSHISFNSLTKAISSEEYTRHLRFFYSPRTTAWTDICSCNICIHHIHVDYAGGRAMQEQLPRHEGTETLRLSGLSSAMAG